MSVSLPAATQLDDVPLPTQQMILDRLSLLYTGWRERHGKPAPHNLAPLAAFIAPDMNVSLTADNRLEALHTVESGVRFAIDDVARQLPCQSLGIEPHEYAPLLAEQAAQKLWHKRIKPMLENPWIDRLSEPWQVPGQTRS